MAVIKDIINWAKGYPMQNYAVEVGLTGAMDCRYIVAAKDVPDAIAKVLAVLPPIQRKKFSNVNSVSELSGIIGELV